MQYISATDARATFSDMLHIAQTEAVIIRKQDKDVAVMISPRAYDKLRGRNRKKLFETMRRAGEYAKKQGLTEEILAELLADES